MRLIRALITATAEGVVKRFWATGAAGELFRNREFFQHYGFSSRPLAGAEGLVLASGGRLFLVASDDRRYRVELEEGEVALYTDEGDKIHLQRGRKIVVATGGTLEVTAATKVTLSGDMEITGNVVLTGNLAVTGNVTATGTILDVTGNSNHHSH